MKTFRSDLDNFEITVPFGWRCPWTGFFRRLFRLGKSYKFQGPGGFFVVTVGDDNAPSDNDFSRGIHSGEIVVYGRTHQWARYMVGVDAALRYPAARRIVKVTRAAYGSLDPWAHMSDRVWLTNSRRHGAGPVVKTYGLLFDNATYTLTASIGFGTFDDVMQDYPARAREAEYDKIVTTFIPTTITIIRSGAIKDAMRYFEATSKAIESMTKNTILEFKPYSIDHFGSPQAIGPEVSQEYSELLRAHATVSKNSSGERTSAEILALLTRLSKKPSEAIRSTGRHDIFVSYKSYDSLLARQVAEQLIASGLNTWFAEYELPLENQNQIRYDSKIKAEIIGYFINRGTTSSKCGLIFTNDDYAKSVYCREEMQLLLKTCGPQCVFEVMVPPGEETHKISTELSWSPSMTFKNNVDEILAFLESHTTWKLAARECIAEGLSCNIYQGKYMGRPYTLNIGDWILTDQGGWRLGPGSEKGPDLRRPVRGGKLRMNLYFGEEHDSSAVRSRSNMNPDDQTLMYEHLLDYANKHIHRIGAQPRGVHLLFHAGFSQFALTYRSEGNWTRKYSVVLKNGNSNDFAEFVFTFSALQMSFRGFCRYAHMMDDVVTSLQWD